MTPTDTPPTGSLHWTLSFHIASDTLEAECAGLRKALDGSDRDQKKMNLERYRDDPLLAVRARTDRLIAGQLQCKDRHHHSEGLAAAIEPMFHDIAEREHLGVVEDYLLATVPRGEECKDRDGGERVELTFDPTQLRWSTEGRLVGVDLGDAVTRTIEMRRFWYVHRDFGLSYHLGITLPEYAHTPLDLYLISTLQKLASPKEFTLKGPGALRRGATPDIAPFRAVSLFSESVGPKDFWQFVIASFEADFADLRASLCPEPPAPAMWQRIVGRARPRPEPEISTWDRLIQREPYGEVPGLRLPQIRSMFYFKDRVFRDLLLPRGKDGPEATSLPLNETFFDVELPAMLERHQHRTTTDDGKDVCVVGREVWSGLDDRGTRALTDGHQSPSNPALCYLFLAGFNQNIMDFLSQDCSEISDSLAPIYPTPGDGQTDYFARFANARAFITYVAAMRSLEVGSPHIGTCPYAFLIHVLTLHNELLARRFEKRASARIELVNAYARAGNWTQAKDQFFEFQRLDRQAYLDHFYENVFRYDTERIVFGELERIRAIRARHTQVLSKLENARTATEEAQTRIVVADDRSLNLLVGFIGLFSVLQVAYMAVEIGKGLPDSPLSRDFGLYMGSLSAILRLSLGLGGLFVVLGGWLLLTFVRRRIGGTRSTR